MERRASRPMQLVSICCTFTGHCSNTLFLHVLITYLYTFLEIKFCGCSDHKIFATKIMHTNFFRMKFLAIMIHIGKKLACCTCLHFLTFICRSTCFSCMCVHLSIFSCALVHKVYAPDAVSCKEFHSFVFDSQGVRLVFQHLFKCVWLRCEPSECYQLAFSHSQCYCVSHPPECDYSS